MALSTKTESTTAMQTERKKATNPKTNKITTTNLFFIATTAVTAVPSATPTPPTPIQRYLCYPIHER